MRHDDGTSTTDGERAVWLQRWHVLRGDKGKPTEYCDGICSSWQGGKPFEPDKVVRTDSGVYGPELGGPAECIAQAPSMLRLLLRLEHAGTIPRFVNDGDNIFDDCSEPCCPCCRCEVVGHNAGCALDADLTACGLATAASRDKARAAIKAAGLWP